MMKYNFCLLTVAISLFFTLEACSQTPKKMEKNENPSKPSVVKTEAEWKKILSPEAYHVLREKGTERPYVNEYDEHFEAGTYVCAACQSPLFESQAKYNSGCGWPAFYDAIDKSKINEISDVSHGMRRVEVTCKACDGHLGHVFPDGPKPTGIRYCINSVSIKFVPKEKKN